MEINNKGFVVANRNCGLGDILGNLALCWYLAKDQGKDLIIDWQKTVYHHHTFGDNLFPLVFNKSNIDGVQLFEPHDFPGVYEQQIKAKYINKDSGRMLKDFKFKNTCFNNKDYFAHRFFSKLEIKPEIQKDINDFYQKNLLNKYVISVHFRFGDHGSLAKPSTKKALNQSGKNTKEQIIENAVKSYSEKINEIKKFHKDAVVLIFTDCELFSKVLSNMYNCIDTASEYPEDGQAFHLSRFKNAYEKIRESVYLTWLMKSHSDFLLYSHSNFNYLPRLFIKNQVKMF